MKTLKASLVVFLMLFGTIGCVEEFDLQGDYSSNDVYLKKADIAKKLTGSVEIIWKGGKKGNDMGGEMSSEMGNQPENRRAFFEFNAHEATDKSLAKGEVVFYVTAEDLTVHREIRATVVNVKIDPTSMKGWFYALVISDTKGCNGGGEPGSHDDGCSDSDHTEGGCSDDTSHDEGCSHDTTDEGGTSEDHTDGGGCTDDHTDEGGCSGSDTEHGGESDMGSPGGTAEKGNPLSGKNCRIGQYILVKVHDLSTPGAVEDGLAWKWFAPETVFDLSIEPKKICNKAIIAGNVVVHI